MAGEIPDLNINVNLNTAGVNAGVQQTEEKLKGITSAVETSTGKFGGLKTVMLGTFAAGEIQKGIQEMTNFLKDSVKAAEEAQTSTVALATAMNDAKINTEANRLVVEKSTTAMTNLGFSGNSTREALTKMVTATGSMTEAQKLMGVAADYARIKHMDLASAATVLTRGTTGAAKAFREYGITLDTTIPKNQAITKAFNELNQKIGGQAAAYAETYAGKLAILGAKSEELKEKVGALLLPVLTKLSTWFLDSLQWLSQHKAILEAVAAVVGAVLSVVIVNITKQLYAQAAAWVAANIQIIAIIAAIGLLVAGFVKLWNSSETFRKVIVEALKIVIEAFGYLIGAIGKTVEAATHLPFIGKHFVGIADAINGAAKDVGAFSSKLDGLSSKKIDIKFPSISDMLAKAGGTAGADPNIAAAGSVAKAAAAKAATAADAQAKKLQAAQDKLVTLQDDYQKVLVDRQTKMDAAKETYQNNVLDANTKFEQAKVDIQQAYQDKVDAATTAHDNALEAIESSHADAIKSIQQKAADNVLQIENQAADKRQSIIQQSIDAMTGAWASATKLDLSTLFDTSDKSAAGLVSAMKDQLAKVLTLQKDAGDLASQGYSQSFIDQVIAKGPDVGDQMAQAILNATPETANQMKSLYGQIETVSNTGLTALAKQMSDGTHFATQAMADAYAQAGVDMQTSLANNQATMTADLAIEQTKYTDALKNANDTFDKAIQSASNARDLALMKAQDTLTNSLVSAQQAFDKSIAAISDSIDKQLSALQAKILATLALIQSLGGASSTSVSFKSAATVIPASKPFVPTSFLDNQNTINFTQTNNIDGSTSATDIATSTLDMIKYGTPVVVTGSGYRVGTGPL